MSEESGEINAGDRETEGKEKFTLTERTPVVSKAEVPDNSAKDATDLIKVRESLDTVAHPPSHTRVPSDREDASPVEQNEPPGLVKKISTEMGDRAFSLVYNLLRGKTPQSIKNRVPVFRTINRDYAGKANQKGESEWTIGTMGKGYTKAMLREQTYDPANPNKAYLRDGPEVVLIKSTIGDLAKEGRVTVRPFGEGGQSEKIILDHTSENPVVFTVVGSNKVT